ncbi:uncharacterized protein IL334_007025 [Kwoniella shivajii]|uniref:Ser-Thr-rich glycosyl-phosphatidyl-inositol-anchored membrane family-domain-containing protein n=1 Tax=Kwoniella shivajii TaxID=564305 RepID=A0ABZ1DBI7_9TREE|nr:hypothetical protein IL334_007025 [Kwoniella shivajii]
MIIKLTIAALTFSASTQATITILYPNSNAIWYKNNTVHMNWTLSDPAKDIYPFRAYLSNGDQSLLVGNHSIADSTPAQHQDVRILLPQIPSGQGYMVNLVNTTDESQIFATSESFEIADGIASTSTTSGSSTSSVTSTVIGDIPNAKTQTSSSNPFPTAATTSATTSSALSLFNGLDVVVVQGLAIIILGLGAGLSL